MGERCRSGFAGACLAIVTGEIQHPSSGLLATRLQGGSAVGSANSLAHPVIKLYVNRRRDRSSESCRNAHARSLGGTRG